MSSLQGLAKRIFDLGFSLIGLLVFSLPIAACWALAALESGGCGFFLQKRVGRFGREFQIIKIRTMKCSLEPGTTVTTSNDPRITRLGRIIRRLKLDEIPQLINVLVGQMSFVGPRPDVPGFADRLSGEDRIILSVRPGITGPATIAFRNEEALLARQDDPEKFNREVLFPWKTGMNRNYVEHFSLRMDFLYIAATLVPCLGRRMSRDLGWDDKMVKKDA